MSTPTRFDPQSPLRRRPLHRDPVSREGLWQGMDCSAMSQSMPINQQVVRTNFESNEGISKSEERDFSMSNISSVPPTLANNNVFSELASSSLFSVGNDSGSGSRDPELFRISQALDYCHPVYNYSSIEQISNCHGFPLDYNATGRCNLLNATSSQSELDCFFAVAENQQPPAYFSQSPELSGTAFKVFKVPDTPAAFPAPITIADALNPVAIQSDATPKKKGRERQQANEQKCKDKVRAAVRFLAPIVEQELAKLSPEKRGQLESESRCHLEKHEVYVRGDRQEASRYGKVFRNMKNAQNTVIGEAAVLLEDQRARIDQLKDRVAELEAHLANCQAMTT